jgi:hypothetical protein
MPQGAILIILNDFGILKNRPSGRSNAGLLQLWQKMGKNVTKM